MDKKRIGIGTVQFGTNYGISNKTGQTPINEVSKILTLALENGIIILDTASAYCESEKVLGQLNLSKFKIISKFLPPLNGDLVKKQLNTSLINLNVKTLYGYLAHRVSNVLENPKQWDELNELKKEGLIEKIGFSFNAPEEAQRVLELEMYPDLVQIPYNYFDYRFKKYIDLYKSMGCEIHTRSAFLQGLFFLKQEDLYPKFSIVAPLIKSIQEKHKENLPGALLNYCLSNQNIDYVIIGLNDSNQLNANLKAMETAKPMEKLKLKIPDQIVTPSLWNI